MMQLNSPGHYAEFAIAIDEMYRLRFRVFRGRLDWAVHADNGMERDCFDALELSYLLLRGNDSQIPGDLATLTWQGSQVLSLYHPIFSVSQSMSS